MSKKLKLFAGLLVLSSPLMALFIIPDFVKKESLLAVDNDSFTQSKPAPDSLHIVNPINNKNADNKVNENNELNEIESVDFEGVAKINSSEQKDKPDIAEASSTEPVDQQAEAENLQTDQPTDSGTFSGLSSVLNMLSLGYESKKPEEAVTDQDIVLDGQSALGLSKDSAANPLVVEAKPVYLTTTTHTETVRSEYSASDQQKAQSAKLEIEVTSATQVFDKSKEKPATVLTSELVNAEKSKAAQQQQLSDMSKNELAFENAHVNTVLKTPKSYGEDDSMPDMPVIFDASGGKYAGDTAALEKVMVDEIVAASEVWSASEPPKSAGSYLEDRVSQSVRDRAEAGLANEVTGWLDQYGVASLSFSLDDNFHLDSYEFDYLMPLWKSDSSLIFSQMGALEWMDRHLVNLGLGYRYFSTDWMLGSNLFVDADQTFGHRRASLGLEAAINYLRLSSNFYVPISGWRRQDVNSADFTVEARAAKGFDTSLTAYLPQYPQLSTTVEYFRWLDDVVDQGGDFHQGATVDSWKGMMETSKGYTVSLGWRPVPLFSTHLTQTLSKQLSDTSLTMNVTYNFDQPLKQQLQKDSVHAESLVQGMQHAMVQRNNKMVLAYQSDPSQLMQIEIILQQTTEDIIEEGVLPLSAQLNTPLPIESYLWQGSGAQFLSSTNKLDTVFIAPEFSAKNDNRYELYLSVQDINKSTARSNSLFFNVLEAEPEYIAKPVFYEDAAAGTPIDITTENYQSIYSPGGADQQQKLFWRYGLEEKPDALSESLERCNQDESCSASWIDPNGILQNTSVAEPAIKSAPTVGIGTYEIELIATIKGTDELRQKVKVDILPAGQSDIAWPEVDDGGSLKVHYQKDLVISNNKPVSKLYPNETVTYQWEHPDGHNNVISAIDTVTGAITVNKPGIVNISATHTSNNNYFKPTTISYTLQVLNPQGGIIWDDDRANNKEVIKETYSSGHTYQITATGPEDAVIRYYIDEKADQNVAQVNGESGLVILNTAGNTQICAEAQYGLLSFQDPISDCYTLEVAPATVNLDWSYIDPVNHEHHVTMLNDVDSTAAMTPSPDDADFTMTYTSAKTEVAEFADAEAGDITLNKVGDTEITATLVDNNNRYIAEPISYKLVVSLVAHPNKLTWNDPEGLMDPPGQIKMVYGENNNIIDSVTLVGDIGDGDIFYQLGDTSNKEAIAVDPETGKVTITGFQNNFVIEALQLAGSVYQESDKKEYQLQVTPMANDGLVWDDGQVADVMRCALRSAGQFELTASGTNSNARISYELKSPKPDGVHNISGAIIKYVDATDEVLADPITVIARQEENQKDGVQSTSSQYQFQVKETCPQG